MFSGNRVWIVDGRPLFAGPIGAPRRHHQSQVGSFGPGGDSAGMYSASKHAVKGFTDALRMELEANNSPISVTLVKPAAINTPFPDHAKNHLPRQPQLPSLVYAREVVA